MKKYSISSIFVLSFLTNLSLHAMDDFINQETNIDSILKIKPQTKYYEDLKYQEIGKYQDLNDKEIKSDYEFNFNIDINKEERTIDGIKIDIGTHF